MSDHSIYETLGYLMTQICRGHRNRAQELLSELGLYTGQEILLMHLWEQDGRTQSELADLMCIQPATLTKSIDRMSQVGLIERRPDTEDGRVSRVYLRPEGRAMRESVEAVWRQVEAESFANLTTEERILLRRLLMQVNRNINPE
ncbi:MAG: MarR family transcriptional regulator [Anaerolineae bacterium]|nr:MarR family transcriptional regulator [Anaerolineae bacterium]